MPPPVADSASTDMPMVVASMPMPMDRALSGGSEVQNSEHDGSDLQLLMSAEHSSHVSGFHAY